MQKTESVRHEWKNNTSGVENFQYDVDESRSLMEEETVENAQTAMFKPTPPVLYERTARKHQTYKTKQKTQFRFL